MLKRFILLLCATLFLFACSKNGDSGNNNGKQLNENSRDNLIARTQSIDLTTNELFNFTSCFDADGIAHGVIFLLSGDIAIADIGTLNGVDLTPLQITTIEPLDANHYQYIVNFSQSGRYTALLSCNVTLESVSTAETIGFVIGQKFDVNFHSDESVDLTVKSQTHINTTDNCDSCHTIDENNSATIVDHQYVIGACISCHEPDHAEASLDTCYICHNGYNASGKSVKHIDSTTDCDNCHLLDSWVPAYRVDHTQVIGVCADCHSLAFTPPMSHINTSNQCDACHTVLAWKPVNNFDHSHALGVCVDCHTKLIIVGATHISTTDACQACHGVDSWKPVLQVDHMQVIGICTDCHTFSATHIPVVQACEMCHTTGSWVTMIDHSLVEGQSCFECHNCINASCKLSSHINTTNNCQACHTTDNWLATALVEHAEVIGTCVSCHNDTLMLVPGAHSGFVTSNLCDACHTTLAWRPIQQLDHTQVISDCSSCHNGVIATAKHDLHIPVTLDCAECHNTNDWLVTMDHALVADIDCIICHDGVILTGLPINHINSSLNCVSCHNTVMWKPIEVMDHAEVIGVCSSCHDNVIAKGKETTHIPTTAECGGSNCHATNAWKPAGINHDMVVGQSCVECHNDFTIGAVGKGLTHIASTDECSACHKSTTQWLPVPPADMDHTQAIGVCVSCHDGVIKKGKSITHIQSTDECSTCHKSRLVWNPLLAADVDHNQVIGSCASCHTRPVTHINSTDLCEACHLAAQFPVWLFTPTDRVDHTQVIGTCSSCHDNVIAKGKGITHLTSSFECDVCHTTTTWFPSAGSAPDHSLFNNNCILCHDGITASYKSSVHIKTSESCDACHAKYPARWVPVAASAVDHAEVIGTCMSCHVKGSGHISTSNFCEACHLLTTGVKWLLAPANVDHSQVLGVCANCHSLQAGHMNTSSLCDACHDTSSFPGWIPAIMNHNGAFGACSTCHNGGAARGLPATHCDTLGAECDNCHTTSNWLLPFADCVAAPAPAPGGGGLSGLGGL